MTTGEGGVVTPGAKLGAVTEGAGGADLSLRVPAEDLHPAG